MYKLGVWTVEKNKKTGSNANAHGAIETVHKLSHKEIVLTAETVNLLKKV